MLSIYISHYFSSQIALTGKKIVVYGHWQDMAFLLHVERQQETETV